MRLIAAGILILLLAVCAPAQTPTGTIQGVVEDATGAVVPGATVRITNTETNETKELKTDSTGRYVQPFLLPATYTVQASAEGFRPARQDSVKLDVGQNRSVDFKLTVGAVTEQVEVIATTPALDVNTSSIGQVIENKRIMDLPLNGRSVFALANLTPGVNPTGGGATPHMGGARNATSEVQIDGVTDIAPENNIGVNQRVYEPQVDAVQEFSVQVNALSAEYGRFAGGVINVATKSGTNAFHGTAYDFLRNSKLDANNFFNNRAGRGKGSFKRNQWGGTAGGPILIPNLYNGRDKSFWFFGFEGTNSRSLSVYTATMPIAEWRTGDFSNLRNSSGQPILIYDPLTVKETAPGSGRFLREPFAGNRLPANRLSPIATKAITYFPQPNTAPTNPYTFTNNYTNSGTAPSDSYRMDMRVDHNFTEKWRMFTRVSLSWYRNTSFNGFGNIATSSGSGTGHGGARNVSMDHTYSFTPTLIGNFRYGFGRTVSISRPFSDGIDLVALGFAPAYRDVAAREGFEFPRMDFDTGHPSLGQAGWTRLFMAPMVHSATATITKVRTGHTLKAGLEFRELLINFQQSGYPSGQFSFGRGWTQQDIFTTSATAGYGLASFLLGLASGGQMTHDPAVSSASGYWAAYLQDDWKVTSRLTLNLGLRYEVDIPRTERFDRYSVWEMDVPSPIAGKVPAGACPSCGNLRGAMRFMDASNRRQAPADKNNWGPRFGFAYRATNKLVVRGGYGITYGPSALQAAGSTGAPGMQGFRGSTGMTATLDSMRTIYATIQNPFPDGFNLPPGRSRGAATELGLGIGESFFDASRNPFVQQWNLNLQQEVPGDMTVEIGYLGNRAVAIIDGDPGKPYNQLEPRYTALGNDLYRIVPNPFYGVITAPTSSLSKPTVEYRQLLRPFPQYTGVTSFRKPTGQSIYHGMTIRADKRFSKGVSMLLAYTTGKVIDDTSSAVSFLGPVASTRLDQYNRRLDRSISSMDVAQRFVLSAVYELPFGKGKRFFNSLPKAADLLVNGWQANGILTLQSGLPLVIGGATNNTGIYTQSQRPLNNGKSAKLTGGTKDERMVRWFDTSVFSQPPNFTFGNTSRTSPDTRAPGTRNTELAFFKNNYFGPDNKLNLQYRVEMFNGFNTTQFSGPSTGILSSNFGQISGVAVGPRQIQMALKLIW